jgi:hypothetical protein
MIVVSDPPKPRQWQNCDFSLGELSRVLAGLFSGQQLSSSAEGDFILKPT